MLNSLLQQLADGKIHSLQQLALFLQKTPSQVQEMLNALQTYGLPLQQSADDYQWLVPTVLLERAQLWTALSPMIRQHIQLLQVFAVIDSTSRHLHAQTGDPHKIAICLADYQTDGYGRQGKSWISPFGSGICLSFKQRYPSVSHLIGLNLAVAVVIVRALQQQGATGLRIKWPNDILWGGRKLAGILLESRPLPTGHCEMVLGIGLNVCLPSSLPIIDQSPVDLQTIMGHAVDRQHLAITLIETITPLLLGYAQTGLSPLLADWQTFDLLAGQQVTLTTPQTQIQGLACGIDAQGALLLEINHQRQRYVYGDVSVRL
ncbi:biotin--[acetyl-CoA-carboxylase] ligase [Beggiatoa leptomitoformis]|uniref:biotin--[biotin carboxyl-carrier protein] ligase n=1 Tax=Beggiatoa leptomitoformis TaxID=288004 RepID=A0A2N9YFX1_9GAMM|nr:biotin--[acetyl-CoA-carboxylase] ligase [Beggiatoa leptomitoformis]AUI69390.1 biotin--[acetyl-CoA-carboxylase] ligase [Beggiatoa leptomitoformis]QGX03717.1 biotin--[acetyl-CoA-carboxylase] ligase [Beggiatoa leptomitoformis]